MIVLEFLWIKWLITSLTIIPFVLANLNNWRKVDFVGFFRYIVLIFFPTSLILLNDFKFFEVLLFILSYFPLFYLCAQDLRRLEVTIHSLFISAAMHLIWVVSIFFLRHSPHVFIENALLIILIIVSIKIVERLRKKIILGNADPIIIVISILGLTLEQSILWLFLVACMPIIFFWKSFRKSFATKVPFIPFCVSAKLIVILIYG